MKEIIKQLKKVPVIPVLTFEDKKMALKISEALIEGGLNTLEITLRTSNALECIEAVKKEFPNILVGAGTILNKKQIKKVKNVGSDFAVSPGFTKELIKTSKKEKLPYLPGASTPSEIMKLIEQEVYFQKFFHASHSGGYKMLETYKSLFPEVDFCPTGGIKESDYKEYLSLSNVICIGGSWIITKEDIENFNFNRLKNKVIQITKNFQ